MPLLDVTIDNPWLKAVIGLVVVVALLTVAALFLIWWERKLAGRIQNRLGPMRVGPYGTLQSVADAIKLMGKEDLRPAGADRWTFALAPFAVFVPAFLTLVAIPWTHKWAVAFLDQGLFYIVAISGVSFIGFLMAGWGSDNKYALLGAMRAAAQLISYEIPLVLSLLAVTMVTGTLSLQGITEWQGRIPLIVWQPLAFFIFTAASLSEMERQPFDIPTAESEVVGGPFIEYSGIRWSMFYFASYANLLTGSLLAAVVFLGGYDWPLGRDWGLWWQLILITAKTFFFICFFIWVRFSLPRMRIDQLMSFAWKILIPLAFLQIFLNGLVLVYDWGDWALLLTSGGALVLSAYLMGASARRPRKRGEPEREPELAGSLAS